MKEKNLYDNSFSNLEQQDINEVLELINKVLKLINKVKNTKINKQIDTDFINKQIEEIEKIKPKKEKKPRKEKLKDPEQIDIKEIEDLIKQVQNTKINKIGIPNNEETKKFEQLIIKKNDEEIKRLQDLNNKVKKVKEIEQIKPKEKKEKKEKKPKTVYDPKKIDANKQLISDYTFNDKMSDRFLTDGAKELFKLQKNKKNDDEDVSQFSITYLQKEPSPKELEQLKEVFKIK
jgi:hypothetical protein